MTDLTTPPTESEIAEVVNLMYGPAKDVIRRLIFQRDRLIRVHDVGYVLVYVGDADWQFFKEQNLYLGAANLTDSVEDAAVLTLDEAEAKWHCMSVKDDWQIWSVRQGLVLSQRSDRHVVREKRADLERQLRELSEDSTS